MFARVLYSVYKAIMHRNELACIALSESIASVSDIDDFTLFKKKIRVLAVDFDGVLSPHGYHEPVLFAKQWLDSVLKKECLKRVYIYSNRPTESRKQYFKIHYPDVKFVSHGRKKPYPDGLYEIAASEEVPIEQVAIVDDRLMTGMLAAIIAGSSRIFIRKPLIDYSKNTTKEIFFTTLRFVEKQIFLKS